jgi:WhiB family redox-sensing transcriptional regulator
MTDSYWPQASFMFQRTDWQDNAACRGEPTDMWFPARGEESFYAKAICNECPVREQCLEYSLEIPNLIGIWGGLSGKERRKLKHIRAQRKPIRHGTQGGYKQHIERDVPMCEPCRKANSHAVMKRRTK